MIDRSDDLSFAVALAVGISMISLVIGAVWIIF